MSFDANENSDGWVLVLTPNRSADWKLIRLFLLACGGLSLLIGTGWALLGAWLILPFAGAEIMLLIFLMLRVAKKSHSQQTLHLNREQVLIQLGLYHPCERWEFLSEFSRFVLVRENPSHLPQVFVTDGRAEVELGSFLNPGDKQALVEWVTRQHFLPRIHSQTVHRKM